MLQTGQVLFPRLSVKFALVLPFKDSMSGTEEPVKSSDCHANCSCMHKSKDQPLPAVREEVPRLLTFKKFRSRCERGRFTQPMLPPAGFATPTSRRSEARPR
jgi:hypothetical protein